MILKIPNFIVFISNFKLMRDIPSFLLRMIGFVLQIKLINFSSEPLFSLSFILKQSQIISKVHSYYSLDELHVHLMKMTKIL